MVTDVPWMIAWYCERTGIWFPVTYKSMKMHLPSVNYVYFSAREQTGSFREQNIKKEYVDNPIFRDDFKLIKEFMRVRLRNPSFHQPLSFDIWIAPVTDINIVQACNW